MCVDTHIYKIQYRKRNILPYFCSHTSSVNCVSRKCRRCRRTSSVRVQSYFARSRISLGRQLHFLWQWAQQDSLKIMAIEGTASRKVLVKFARKCREVTWEALLRHPIPQLGGPGVIVQIDESKFNHKSKVSTQTDRCLFSCYFKRGAHIID